MKSYTDIEQSRKLAEILPIESADMCYVSKDDRGIEFFEEPDVIDGTLEDVDIRCWSLAALLGVLPEPYQMTSNKEGKVQLMVIHHLEKDYYDNPVDACVAMIDKLHELKML